MGTRTKALLTVALLAASGLWGLGSAVVNVMSPVPGPGAAAPELNSGVDAGLLAVAGCFFLGWMLAVRADLRDAGIRLRWSTPWAVVGWLIPVVSLVVPLLVMNEVDRAGRRSAMPFVLWATSWTAYQVALLIEPFYGRLHLPAVVGALQLVAAVACILLVLRITAARRPVLTPPRPVGTAR